jgi:ribonuclease D
MAIHLYKNDLPDGIGFEGAVAVDTETMGLKVQRDRLCVVQLCDGGKDSHLIQFELGNDYAAPNLRRLFTDGAIQKIFHFARFDVAVIKTYLGVDVENIFCTKIASKLARTYTDGHGLKDLCAELIGVTLSKAQQCSNWGQEELSKEQLKYAAQDVLYLHQLRDNLIEILKSEKREKLATECFKFLRTRAELDNLGWENLDIFKH